MKERIAFAIPFEGFHNTELDEALDDHILSLFGITWESPLAEKLLMKVDTKATHTKIAEQYAIEWLNHRNLKTGQFEEYIPPRTVQPRCFLKVSVELEELKLSYAAAQEKYERLFTLETWANLKPEYAWEEAWWYLEYAVGEEQTVPQSIREALLRNGHMDPIFKE